MKFFFNFNRAPLYNAIDKENVDIVKLLLTRPEINANIKSIKNQNF